MERDTADRAAFLREACAGDEGLRREVESLLGYEGGADALLERPAAAVAAPMLNTSVASAVLTGRQIGPYQIGALLGAGGMGEVYRAHDTQLHREVALKVLPEGFTTDADRLARFRREAQVLASLNHPNIAAIYGFEESDGVRALALELVDGPTLADLIARGPIPLDDALPIARQIGEALEAAHERSIIHRDLKPANVKVTSEGTVKVLDFGLAKLVVPDPVTLGTTHGVSQSPTITSPAVMTGVGVILGTAAYMSPEQAKGREADRRSDVWAFGCVLYEMLAGKRAFPGDDLTETLAAVIKSDPDWNGLPSGVPPSIHRLLRRCLHKDRKTRLADASSLRLEIDDTRNYYGVGEPSPAPAPSRWRVHLTWAAATSLLVLAAAALAWTLRSTQPIPEVRFAIVTPPATDPASLAISRDGQKLVFEAVSEGHSQLWLRELGATIARPLPRTDDARRPFWSFDGRAVGFFSAGKLKWLDLDGGTVHSLADVPGTDRGAAWNRDGVIVFQPVRDWFFRVSTSRDKPVPVPRPTTTDLNPFLINPRDPRFLPDGARFMYLGNTDDVFLTSLDGLPPRRLFTADRTPAYASGHLFFVRHETLFAQPFDPERLSLGDPTALADDVGVVVAAESPGGVLLAFRSSFGPSLRQLAWVDRAGNVEKLGEPFASGTVGPALSPDGKTVAVSRVDLGSRSELGLLDIARPVFNRFTFDPFINAAPVFSPDGTRIVFQMNPTGVTDLYQREISGAGKDELLLATPEPKMPSDWHGRFLLYHSRSSTTGWDVWALPMDGTGQPVAVANSAAEERNAVFSRDGKWIAYQSNESGRHEIHVQSFPGPGIKKRISTSGGAQARWRPDGKELFYIDLDDRLMAVPIRLDPDGRSIDPGVAVPLFTTHVGGAVQTIGRQQYFASSDGTRFLMFLSTQQPIDAPIIVILNWKPKQ